MEYRQALWLGDEANQLEEILRDVWERLPQSTGRVVDRADGSSVMGVSLVDHGDLGASIHCVKYTDRQAVGVVPMVGDAAPTLGSLEPDALENFLDRDFFLLVRGNHIISLNASKGAAMARTFLHGLINQAGRPPHASQFDFVQIASTDVARRIKAGGGIESIQLDVALEEATADVLARESAPRTAYGKLVGGLMNIVDSLARSDRGSSLQASEGGKMRLQISVPDGDLESVKAAATRIGLEIADDEDAADFVLKLRDGGYVKPNAIAVRKLVTLSRSANSFQSEGVRREMEIYMGELQMSGQLGV